MTLLVLMLTDASQIVYCIRVAWTGERWTPELVSNERIFRFFTIWRDTVTLMWMCTFINTIFSDNNQSEICSQCEHIKIILFYLSRASSWVQSCTRMMQSQWRQPWQDTCCHLLIQVSHCWYLYDVNHQHECFIMLWLLCVL